MTTPDAIQRDVLVEGLEDYVGLWQVAKHVSRRFGVLPIARAREMTLATIRPLLIEGLVEAGLPSEGGGFAPWQGNAQSSLDRIEMEWRALDRVPNVWDICWFRNTEKGNAVARTL